MEARSQLRHRPTLRKDDARNSDARFILSHPRTLVNQRRDAHTLPSARAIMPRTISTSMHSWDYLPDKNSARMKSSRHSARAVWAKFIAHMTTGSTAQSP